MKLPNETCRVIISLKDNTLIKGVYDPAIGFMTSDGRCIWKENVLDFKLESPKESEIMELSPSEYVDCEKAQKNGELCLGYGDDEDEPCEHCKNCIKCETGYYQLGETEKDEELTKAREIIEELSKSLFLAKGIVRDLIDDTVDFKESKERAIYCYEQGHFDTYKEAEQLLKEIDK